MAAAAKVSVTVKDEESCGYCLQRLPYMNDPRLLPCCHMFCLPCLKEDLEKNDILKCIICSRSYEELGLNDLPPVATTSRNGQEEEERDSVMPCDLCEESKLVSVCHCLPCMKNICQQHLKLHNVSAGANHPVVFHKPIENPSQCLNHEDKTVSVACSFCLEMFCDSCDTGAACTDHENKMHKLVDVEKLAGQLDGKIKEELQTLSEKVTNFSRQEKTAWNNADNIKDKVQELTEEVDRVAAKQISMVSDKAESLKAELGEYLSEVMKEAESHAAQLFLQAECIQRLWDSTRLLSRNSREGVVKSYARVSSGGTKALLSPVVSEVERIERDLLYSPPLPDNLLSVMNLTTTKSKFPTRLKYVTSKCAWINVRTVSWDHDQLIVTNPNDYAVDFYDKELAKTKRITKEAEKVAAIAALPYHGLYKYVAMMSTEISRQRESSPQKVILAMADESFERRKQIDENVISAWNSQCCELAVHPFTNQIFVANAIHSHLTVYDSDGDYQSNVKVASSVESNPTDIKILPDGSFLMLLQNRTAIGKFEYDAKTKTAREVWLNISLSSVFGFSFDCTGYIYVSSQAERCVYVLSPTGTLMNKLHHHKLKEVTITDIAVKEDLIAIGAASGLYLMRMATD